MNGECPANVWIPNGDVSKMSSMSHSGSQVASASPSEPSILITCLIRPALVLIEHHASGQLFL